jgi:His/Glu/Gln/Arg/opine family amino acid ABC transporter permease subunit
MNYTFHWYQAFNALPQLLRGAVVTIEVAVLSMVIGIFFGVLLALGRNSKNGLLHGVSTAWVEGARNTPALFQIYMAYFGLGSLGIFVDSFPALLIGISFNNAGYLAETAGACARSRPRRCARRARSA